MAAKEPGMCAHGNCRRQARPGRKSCKTCAKRAVRYQRKYQANRRRKGLCWWCPRPAAAGLSLCEKHRQAHNKTRTAQYHRARKAGECTRCGAPCEGWACFGCRLERADDYAGKKQEEARRDPARPISGPGALREMEIA